MSPGIPTHIIAVSALTRATTLARLKECGRPSCLVQESVGSWQVRRGYEERWALWFQPEVGGELEQMAQCRAGPRRVPTTLVVVQRPTEDPCSAVDQSVADGGAARDDVVHAVQEEMGTHDMVLLLVPRRAPLRAGER